ncbi:hypothetical protein MMC25_002826 [Agyrium rufum]|nr:hypothetical protein [Agyrium rufum]
MKIMGVVATICSRLLVGTPPNHWLYTVSPPAYDLTRPSPPVYSSPKPENAIRLRTTTEPIDLNPELTALVIVDMQNLFLSTAPPDGPANLAKEALLKVAIPAARKLGIRVLWLNWGLTDQDLKDTPPSVVRAFGFNKTPSCEKSKGGTGAANFFGKGNISGGGGSYSVAGTSAIPDVFTTDDRVEPRDGGLGFEMGRVKLANGTVVDGGRRLMRNAWNTDLPPDLAAAYEEGQQYPRPDVIIYKDRMSGFWDTESLGMKFLKSSGIRSLLFGGTKTDMCVLSSLLDAFHRGFDVILMKDACGTTSPSYASKAVEFNCATVWGFVSDCAALKEASDRLSTAR